MLNKGFIFDYSKCVGCHACIVGCYIENKTNPPIAWRQINSFNKIKIPLAGFLNLSIACNHCVEAPCLKACPAKAYSRDEQTGAIIHQSEKCIGCKYCTWACPFDAPKYNSKKGIIEKCHLCNHLIINGLTPACAKQCPTGALSFHELDISTPNIPFGIPTTEFKPRIKTLNSSVLNSVPEMNIAASGYNSRSIIVDNPYNKIHAAEEWPLIIFTFIFSLLTGWITSFDQHSSLIFKGIFLFFGLIGLALSAFHLGKPLRAPRSILNLKTSWLSREILLSGVFMLLSFIYLFFLTIPTLKVITILLGILLVVSIEMVYSLPDKKYTVPLHSANTILTAFMFGLFFMELNKLLVSLLVLKSILYIIRKMDFRNFNQLNAVIGTFLRIVLGLLIPISILLFSVHINYNIVFVCLLIGELLDRIEYYNDIFINSPSKVLSILLSNKLS